MLKDLPSLQSLIRQLQNIPYLASKNIYRVAMHFLESDLLEVERFCLAVVEAKKKVKRCSCCFNWCEGESSCFICSMTKRNKSIICVVENWHDLVAIERTGGYDGVYHVLGGALCPLDGIGPEDLTIDALLTRIANGKVSEIIFATNPTPEGEATASYIASKLGYPELKISKLVSGIPIGSSLENMDRITVYKALSGRRPF